MDGDESESDFDADVFADDAPADNDAESFSDDDAAEREVGAGISRS
jgi:hypothetical protein